MIKADCLLRSSCARIALYMCISSCCCHCITLTRTCSSFTRTLRLPDVRPLIFEREAAKDIYYFCTLLNEVLTFFSHWLVLHVCICAFLHFLQQYVRSLTANAFPFFHFFRQPLHLCTLLFIPAIFRSMFSVQLHAAESEKEAI